jgi:energy-coupling factor transporter ATP-binding protein EcfA2
VPVEMALGKIREARSKKPHDTLPLAALIDWYLQRSASIKLSPEIMSSLRTSFRGEDTDVPTIVRARLQKIEREIKTHAAFAEQRDLFAREYLESEAGRQRVQDLIDQTVKKKASEIQREVDKQQQALAARRDELAKQLQLADAEHKQLLTTLQNERDTLQNTISELKAAATDLQGTLAKDASTLAIKMREQIPLIAALSGGRSDAPVVAEPPSKPRADFLPIQPSKAIKPVADEKKLVEDLHADLAGQGLNFARDFVANVYTCLKAEALNLIMGPPGYGKSMLVAALARSLGHAEALLWITVRRSWAEDRHLLGFFDSFNKRYDPGPTKLVSRMLQADADWRTGRQGIYLVLLDEFNLASPEYYFAQLLQALPSDEPVREVALYDPAGVAGDNSFPGRVPLGPSLRFWGTINYDETTERLSPRTLDRTGMIFLGDADVRPSPDEKPQHSLGVSGKDLFETFLRNPADCPDDCWSPVSEVIGMLRSSDASLGPRIELSPRVQKGIRRYLANSVGVLDPRVAADFVVQQRILPVVRGRGDEFFARVRRLAELLVKQSLDRTARHVEDALRRSELQFGDLDFLSS